MTKSIQNPKADGCFRSIQYHLKTLHICSMAGVIRGTSLCVLEIPKSDMGVSSKMVWALLHALKPPIWFKTKTKSTQKSFTNQSKIFFGGGWYLLMNSLSFYEVAEWRDSYAEMLQHSLKQELLWREQRTSTLWFSPASVDSSPCHCAAQGWDLPFSSLRRRFNRHNSIEFALVHYVKKIAN